MAYAAKIKEKDGQMWVKLPPLLQKEVMRTNVRVVVIHRVGDSLSAEKLKKNLRAGK
jgi:hypothetical protein